MGKRAQNAGLKKKKKKKRTKAHFLQVFSVEKFVSVAHVGSIFYVCKTHYEKINKNWWFDSNSSSFLEFMKFKLILHHYHVSA